MGRKTEARLLDSLDKGLREEEDAELITMTRKQKDRILKPADM